MHKYFAKPVFLGKIVNFLPECHSTNEELMSLIKKGDPQEGQLIVTDFQTAGKGQRGNIWLSERGKNLLFSIVLKPGDLPPEDGYLMNIIMGLAIAWSLNELIDDLTFEIKWPNDIYTNDLKIAGILIETGISGEQIEYAVLGAGINVNQKHFELRSATSLSIETGREYDLMEILEGILVHLEALYLKMKNGAHQELFKHYYQLLRWKGEKHTFRAGGVEFEGMIMGVDLNGNLLVKQGSQIRLFRVKEIEFLY